MLALSLNSQCPPLDALTSQSLDSYRLAQLRSTSTYNPMNTPTASEINNNVRPCIIHQQMGLGVDAASYDLFGNLLIVSIRT